MGIVDSLRLNPRIQEMGIIAVSVEIKTYSFAGGSPLGTVPYSRPCLSVIDSGFGGTRKMAQKIRQ